MLAIVRTSSSVTPDPCVTALAGRLVRLLHGGTTTVRVPKHPGCVCNRDDYCILFACDVELLPEDTTLTGAVVSLLTSVPKEDTE